MKSTLANGTFGGKTGIASPRCIGAERKMIVSLEKKTGFIVVENLVDGRPDAEICRLFGTHILPTSWTRPTRLEYVQYQLQHLNPDVDVVIAGRNEFGYRPTF